MALPEHYKMKECGHLINHVCHCNVIGGAGPGDSDDLAQKHDAVNHPKHYTNHPSGVECIQITRHMNFNLGNAMKYIWRADLKNGLEDLKKAAWYIQDEIKRQEGLKK